jgi:predicted kinase
MRLPFDPVPGPADWGGHGHLLTAPVRPPSMSPTLVVVCGLPGSGKSTVGEAIADRLDARLLRTDVVRKDLVADPQYTPAENAATYEAFFSRAAETLDAGTSVVLDATFVNRENRGRARGVADRAEVAFELVHVTCEEAVVRERIAAREGDASDADFDVYLHKRENFDPFETEPVTIDNSGSLDATMRQVEARF